MTSRSGTAEDTLLTRDICGLAARSKGEHSRLVGPLSRVHPRESGRQVAAAVDAKPLPEDLAPVLGADRTRLVAVAVAKELAGMDALLALHARAPAAGDDPFLSPSCALLASVDPREVRVLCVRAWRSSD